MKQYYKCYQCKNFFDEKDLVKIELKKDFLDIFVNLVFGKQDKNILVCKECIDKKKRGELE